MAPTRPLIAVAPASALSSRARLLGALARVFDVRFAPAEWAAQDAAGLVVLEPGAAVPARSPSVPSLIVDPSPTLTGRVGEVLFGEDLGPPLAGRRLPDVALGGHPAVRTDPGDRILAWRDGAPVWARRRRAGALEDVVSLAPDELARGAALRDHLRPGRLIALLPLVDLLRRVAGGDGWRPPPLRATFLFDDPNLHWPTYGYLDFPALARHAREHAYHAAMAVVPLDSWAVHRRAAATFRANPRSLSLVVHGVDHAARELERHDDDAAADAAVARALRGTARLARRAAVPVELVMVPPHNACGPAVTRALARAGFDALTQVDGRMRASDPELAAWGACDLLDGGLPVIPRLQLPSRSDGSRDAGMEGIGPELVLNAYLRRPLVLYGHHYDAAPGLAPLAEAAAWVSALGPVAWMTLGQIAASNHATRIEGTVLELRPGSRRARVEVPAGVSRLVVDPRSVAAGELVVVGDARGEPGEPLPVVPGTVVVRLMRRDAGPPPDARAGRRPPGSAARRLASESRDRLLPARDRLRARRHAGREPGG